MKLTAENIILFIHPTEEKTKKPILDEISYKIAYAIETGKPNFVVGFLDKNKKASISKGMTLGHHTCKCGATSEGSDYKIAEGLYTNSLGAHYVAFHRNDVPKSDIEKISKLTYKKDYIPRQGIFDGVTD